MKRLFLQFISQLIKLDARIWVIPSSLLLLYLGTLSFNFRVSTLDFLLLDSFHRYCHTATPKASDEIVHVHIDDQALETIGRWPWPRAHLADVVNELNRAEARIIALDLLLDNPQAPRLVKRDDPITQVEQSVEVNDDELLATAIQKSGNVILAAHLANSTSRKKSGADKKIREEASRINLPLPAFMEHAIGVGGVDIQYDNDGRLRTIPHWYKVGDEHYPHLAILIAAKYYKRSDEQIKIGENGTVFTSYVKQKEIIRIPNVLLEHLSVPAENTIYQLPLTWPNGSSDWRLLYSDDYFPKNQLNIGRVVELAAHRRYVEENELAIDRTYLSIAGRLMPTEVEAYEVLIRKIYRDEADEGEIDGLIVARDAMREKIQPMLRMTIEELEKLETFEAGEEALLNDLQRKAGLIKKAIDSNANILIPAIERAEIQIESMVKNKVVIVGWTALGSIADFVPTSLHDKCPGSIVIGAALNGILTNQHLHNNDFPGHVFSVMLMLLVFFVAALARPFVSLVSMIVLQLSYVLVCGYLLFDLMNILYVTSLPMIYSVVMWTLIMTFRFLTEQKDKARITEQFSHYLAPNLVKLLVEDPEQIVRGYHELSCAFIDIQQFTAISDQLGPQETVPLLNRYLYRMTEHLMVRDAYVNKYLGDGILAIWGAPIRSDCYALDATLAALGCLEAVEHLNADEENKDSPDLHIRAGITTGPMVIDDIGAPPLRTDYTIVGHAVNLASRLEQINKMFDTQILTDQRTVDIVQDEILTRKIGLIQIEGMIEPQMIHEVMSLHVKATPREIQLSILTAGAVDAYIAGDFKGSQLQWENIESQYTPSKLSAGYLYACDRMLRKAPKQFNGCLVMPGVQRFE